MGHALQAGTGQSPAKQAAIHAALPQTVEATTINKVCASGLKAVCLAAQEIMLGYASTQVAGGMESMSNVPLYTRKQHTSVNAHVKKRDQPTDGLEDGLRNVYDGFSMGRCADELAMRYRISRRAQDEYALRTYRRAATALARGAFRDEIAPVSGQRTGLGEVATDTIRNRNAFQHLETLPPAFLPTGTATAGNSCALGDGASAVVLVTAEIARQHCQDAKVFARIVSFADASTTPGDFAVAPSKAIRIALDRANLTVDQISTWEINEAFALVVQANEDVRSRMTDIVITTAG